MIRRVHAVVCVVVAGPLLGCAALTPSGPEPAVTLAGDEHCPAGSSVHGPDLPAVSSPLDESAQFPWRATATPVADGFDPDDPLFVFGGDPGGGIPALDTPCLAPVADSGNWLEPSSPVLAVEVDGDARAYPLAILHYHEIVNDVVGGTPVAVTYCPLCNSGLAFEREVAGQILDFAVSGRLHRSNLVMYDRQHRNLWLQFTGEAIAGEPFVGTALPRLMTWHVSWEEFAAANPRGWVLTRDTGHDRDYDTNPYAGYIDAGPPEGFDPFFGDFPVDVDLGPKSRVVGLAGSDGDAPIAIPHESLWVERRVALSVAGQDVLVLWAPGMADALDADLVDDGRDIGQVGTYRSTVEVDGRELTLTMAPDPSDPRRFVDQQTGSRWTVLGQADEGPLEGHRLEPVVSVETLWSTWYGFHPTTEVWGS